MAFLQFGSANEVLFSFPKGKVFISLFHQMVCSVRPQNTTKPQSLATHKVTWMKIFKWQLDFTQNWHGGAAPAGCTARQALAEGRVRSACRSAGTCLCFAREVSGYARGGGIRPFIITKAKDIL